MTLTKASVIGCFIILIMISCSQQSSVKEESENHLAESDSSVVVETAATESTVAEEESEPEFNGPPIDVSALATSQFNFFAQAITGDAREDSVISALDRTIKEFNSQGFVTINTIYKHEDMVTGGVINEEETWYYNADRQLCAASKSYKSDRTTESSHYLFVNDELVAMILDSDFYDEGAGYTNNLRIARSKCPLCGVKIANDDGDGNELSEIDESSLSTYANDLFSRHEDMLKTFKGVTEITKKGDRDLAFVTVDSNNGVDTIRYSIDPNLVQKFFRNATTTN